ncbi:hypothetical protein [Rhizobium binae]|uniref:hypothetical protein n=1 Tax=Rhizobium binae TaxID=1138190 RepID=UPI003DA81DFC
MYILLQGSSKASIGYLWKARGGDDLASFFIETSHRIGRWSPFHLSTLKAIDDLQNRQNRGRYRQYQHSYFKTQKASFLFWLGLDCLLMRETPANLLVAVAHPVLVGALLISKFVATPAKVAARRSNFNDDFYAKLSIGH